jgi:glucan 1,3-beta-glucosidase
MTDFNCTFTDETIGDLPVVGLFSEWDDSTRANPNVPALDETWDYSKLPARGVNLGGWFSLEPFITPSLFDFPASAGIIDEATLCEHLGPEEAAKTLENHYATFMTEQDFKDIVDAGLDHLRIPFSYWAVEMYDRDPYVLRTSWRYLLRALEWARKYGLRVKLDLHAVPGSQNGWNHSGRQGAIAWLNGTNGDTNAKRSLDVHDKLSKFFAQPRYKNVLAFYGLVNEPAKVLDQARVISWTEDAFDVVKANGLVTPQVFSEGIQGLPSWKGKLQGHGNSLVLDAHQYMIFGGVLKSGHTDKIKFACDSFTKASRDSVNTATGFGPTMIGEWSQADTDCVQHLNGVNAGSRWEGTFGEATGTPWCPTQDEQCSCELANADPSEYTDEYKLFLKTFAIAQMDAFEASWGWFYWTWKTESAAQWSYKHGLDHGYMPAKANERDWSCKNPIPSFGDLPEWF